MAILKKIYSLFIKRSPEHKRENRHPSVDCYKKILPDHNAGFVKLREYLRALLTPPKTGMEIGPSFNPILPKKQGYNVYVTDYLKKNDLIEKYKNDPNASYLIKNIEEVDIVDNGANFRDQLAALEPLDFILSSHNFEHLPNPVKFLLRCQEALKDGGKCYFIIPDRRGTFDYFRPVSSAGQILDAYLNDSARPPFSAVFDQHAYMVKGNAPDGNTELLYDIESIYKNLKLTYEQNPYVDAHCFVYTPASFKLLINILQKINIIDLYLTDIVSYSPFEFMAVLEKSPHKNNDNIRQLNHEILEQAINSFRSNFCKPVYAPINDM